MIKLLNIRLGEILRLIVQTLFIFFTPAISQIDTTLKEFYPLRLGNLWQYRDESNTLYTEQVAMEDTILPNGNHYYGIGVPPNFITGYYFVRIDSLLRVQKYGWDPNDDCGVNQEYSMYRLNEPIGSTWKVCFNWVDFLEGPPYFMRYTGRSALLDNPKTMNLFGSNWEIMSFLPGVYSNDLKDTMWAFVDWSLARGLGIIREETVENRYRYLTGAIIDGVTYGTIVAVEDIPGTLPAIFSLGQNYPNPFNSSTIIKYSLPKETHTILRIYNVLGEVVSELIDEDQAPGQYQLEVQASALSSGTYYYQIITDLFSKTKIMLLIK